VSEASPPNPVQQPRRRWYQFRLWKLLIVLVASVGMIWLAVTLTSNWELTWVKSAKSLTLHDPEVSLTDANLQNFLKDFECDESLRWGLRCTIGSRRTGEIQIDGQTYPVEFFLDKFLGDVLAVRGRGRTVEVFRSWRNMPKDGGTINTVRGPRQDWDRTGGKH
jgi:hypothetical protein